MRPQALSCGVLGLFAALLLAPAARAQPSDLGSLYGNQNLQYIIARYLPVMTPDQGTGGEVLFGFNTSSRATEDQSEWKRFGGVALGGGGFFLPQADLGKYEERDVSAGYLLLMIEGKLFQTVEGPLRPYLGYSVGLGYGSLWMEHDPDLPEPPLSGMQFFALGAELGMQLQLDEKRFLVLAVGTDARLLQYGGESKFVLPVMITVGLCDWRGRL